MALRALWDVTQQFQNKNGSNLTSGKIYIYYQGRTALATTYHDEDGTVVNSNPVLLDNNGRATAFADPIYSYTIVVCDYYGKELFSQDITLHDAISTAEDVVVLGTDGTVLVNRTELPNGVQYDLSVNTEIIATKEDVSDLEDEINDKLDDKKDKQTALTFNGAATKTVKKITQNANGEMNVEFEDIDLPPEVPNVEITSEDNSIQVNESTDVQTNTKTFDLSVNVDDPLEYGQFRATNVTGQAQLTKIKGNLDISNYAIKLKKGNSYHFTVRGSYVANSAANTYNTITYIEYSSFNGINVNVDNTITDSQYFEISYDIYNYSNTGDYNIAFSAISSGKVSELWVEVHNLNGVSINGSGGGGSSYDAGDAIDLTNDTISVKYGKGLTVNASNELEVKAGNGLTFDEDTLEIEIDSEVTDVVETVEKLKEDLDTQITTNFDMPNISQVYDFADPNVSTLANGACMLCQSFTIPINHEFRTTTDDADTPTLFGIYAQQSFAHKIMLALYEYTYAAEGEEHGSSTYVGDTGPVTVVQGVNEFPLKNRNPSITELRSDKVYYATLYLPNAAMVNGLLLAGCPGYGNQSIPAEPRLSCAVENITWDGSELDMSDPTTTLNHYQEVIIPGQPVYYQYYIGPWQSGYNERQTAPRFYMQIRNGEFNVPVVPTAPFNDLGDALPHGTADQSNIPSFQPSQSNSAFRDVTPLLNVTITSFEWIDGMQNAAGWAAANCVYDSGFANNLSGVSNSVVDLGQVVTGEYPGYAHRITFTTPITLTAGTTYRFLCGCTNGSPYFKVWLDPTDVIHVGNNGWYVVDTNVLRIDHQMGMYNKLYDNNNNHYVI